MRKKKLNSYQKLAERLGFAIMSRKTPVHTLSGGKWTTKNETHWIKFYRGSLDTFVPDDDEITMWNMLLKKQRSRDRAVAARGVHNPKVGGANPSPATNN